MSYKSKATTVISNDGLIDWSRVKNVPAYIRDARIAAVNNCVNQWGGTLSVSVSVDANKIAWLTFTQMGGACDCACDCNCQCSSDCNCG
ncbi:hypothetical protein PQJ75_00650 [Rhodoplanes sp. TEM]|uniref:Uncharacterized protein n=1 Tax=Rhodoplanes tepidamans TaxID=200616 RepID=A0ABT5J5U4_RHOTP|nr:MULTISPECIES: hypothetical protein [Rhodoplanes]MDC7784761.1 hypothetical protein [Rhodoplanes tepidamans]MDC7982228.1 hypothetical protein [Rhodoplanes sp. TEM]MDQ0356235.1 hypothetical protein [Rhodoplanes tepidamans]